MTLPGSTVPAGTGQYRFLIPQPVALADTLFDDEGAMAGIGLVGSETLPCLVSRVRAFNDLSAQLLLVPLANEIHAAETGPIPAYDPRITLPFDSPEFVNLIDEALAEARSRDGEDGSGYEVIFQTTINESVKPSRPASTSAQRAMDEYHPTGWDDDPQGVAIGSRAEWVCIRIGSTGKWSQFSPVRLWARYAFDGTDGPGIEFIFRQTTTLSRPSTPRSTSAQRAMDEYHPTGWDDDQQGTNSVDRYEWACKRTGSTGAWSQFTTPALWAVYSVDGDDGRGIVSSTQVGNTVTLTYTDGTTDTFTVGEGVSLASTPQTLPDGTIRIRFSDGTVVDLPPAAAGRGISTIVRAGDTVTITFDDGTTSNYAVQDGVDGFGFEFIFTRTTTSSAPTRPVSTSAQRAMNEYHPTGWDDDPMGVNSTDRYEWYTKRTGTNENWSQFGPVLEWNSYIEPFTLGNLSEQRIFAFQVSSSAPPVPTSARNDNTIPAGWYSTYAGAVTASSPNEAVASYWTTTRLISPGVSWGTTPHPVRYFGDLW